MSTRPEHLERLVNIMPHLKCRAGLLSSIRSFFDTRGFIDVATPVLIAAPAPEEYIEAPYLGELFLRTSPELEMKCMLAAGYEKIYQVGNCFRSGEYGNFHRPEFTMLEWYEVGADYRLLLDFTCTMLLQVVEFVCEDSVLNFNGSSIDFSLEWEVLSVCDAFLRYTETSVDRAVADGLFEELLVEKIEPELGFGRPSVLIDYPSEFSALAKLKASDSSVCERWELYLGGIEIANAYTELTDPLEQRERFKAAMAVRAKNGYRPYPDNTHFLEALDYGIPDAGGCALGVDRLAMILSDVTDIAQVTF